MGTIYGLKTAESRILYVGRTRRKLSTRRKRHVDEALISSQKPVHTWIRQVGPEAVEIVPLEEVSQDQLIDREVYWILKLKTLTSQGGYNLRLGDKLVDDGDRKRRNDSIREHYATPEGQQKLESIRQNAHANQDVQRRRRESIKAFYSTEEGRAIIRRASLAVSQETRQRAGQLGRHNRWHRDRDIVKPGCPLCES